MPNETVRAAMAAAAGMLAGLSEKFPDHLHLTLVVRNEETEECAAIITRDDLPAVVRALQASLDHAEKSSVFVAAVNTETHQVNLHSTDGETKH